MIEKLEPIKEFDCSDTPQAKIQHHSYHNDCIKKINELVDAVNELAYTINDHKCQLNNHLCRLLALEDPDDETPAENVQKDTKSCPENVQDPVCFISTTYPSDNKTTVFLGQKGASVEFNQPLPAGFIITIKEN